MVVLKKLFLSVSILISLLDEGYAGRPGVGSINEENPTTKKRKAETLHPDSPKRHKSKALKIPIFSPLLTCSPTTAELKFLSPIRRDFVQEGYQLESEGKRALSSPFVRKTFHEKDAGNYWSRHLRVDGKTVYQADFLFNPNAEVLTKDEEWTTNLKLLKEGRCPIGHKGIANENDRLNLKKEQIRARQNSYRIELHHLTQKDTGLDKDPLCEMSHAAHMGKNGRMVMEYIPAAGTSSIVHSSLGKDEALALCEDNQFIVTNILHFRAPQQTSFIDRGSFDPWREQYWKNRAAAIEKGNFIGKEKLPCFVKGVKMFETLENIKY